MPLDILQLFWVTIPLFVHYSDTTELLSASPNSAVIGINLDISFKIVWFHLSRDVFRSPFHNDAAYSLVRESEASPPKRPLEFLRLSLSVSLKLIKALSGWRFQPESSYHYELPVALWAASTTANRTPGDYIWPEESGFSMDNPPFFSQIYSISVFFMLHFLFTSLPEDSLSESMAWC